MPGISELKVPAEIVAFSPADAANPKNWNRNKKRLNVFLICVLAFVGVLGSSFYAPAEAQIRLKYGVSADVSSLGLTLYVLGFAFGPLLCPMGEMYGRKRPYEIAWPLFIISLAPSAWVDNVMVIILFRFFAGVCASAPLNNGGAINSDLYSEIDLQGQAIAASYFTFSAFCGPIVAPVAGFFVSTRFPNELWVLRIQFFLAIAVYPVVFVLPETHGPTILAARAKMMRKAGNLRAWAYHELHQKTTAQLMRINLIRPTAMLFREPIVMGSAAWTALSYGILYFSFESYPVIFIQQHDIPVRFAGLPFIPIAIGMLLAVVPYVPLVRFFQRLRFRTWLGDANDTDSPESRLKLALLACLCLPISTFWLAWTSGPEIHWIVPALSGIPFGFANITIFFTFLTYTSHTFTLYTASAGAASVFARSVIGCVFPVAAHSVLERLGTKWGISLFGFLSLALIPIPIIFLRHGKHLRATSHYAQEALTIMYKMQAEGTEKEAGSGGDGTRETVAGDLGYIETAEATRASTPGSRSNMSALEAGMNPVDRGET